MPAKFAQAIRLTRILIGSYRCIFSIAALNVFIFDIQNSCSDLYWTVTAAEVKSLYDQTQHPARVAIDGVFRKTETPRPHPLTEIVCVNHNFCRTGLRRY